MSNHPNRNWRGRMKVVADQFIESPEAKALIEIPMRKGSDALRNRIRMAYEIGYKDGRKTGP